MKFVKIIKKIIRSNGFFLGNYLILTRIVEKIKSFIYSWILDAPGINLGSGSKIFGKKFIKFGSNVSVYQNLWLEAVHEYDGQKFNPEVTIGDRVKMSQNVHITGIKKIEIGSDVLLGSNVYISDHNHGVYSGQEIVHSDPEEAPANRELYSSGTVSIGNNVWIGDNVNIVGPVVIGSGAIIAANSVVRGNVTADTIVAGAPARAIKKFNHVSKKWEKYV